MKATLTRYGGKVLSVFKQDGFWGGTKKIFQAILTMLRPIGQGDVLFIASGTIGNSWRFRVQNVAEELELNGFKTSFVIQEHPLLLSYVDKFSVFVFHLTNYTPQIKALIEKIKFAGKEIIFETDDLLFDAELVKQQDFFKNSNALQKQFYAKGIGSEILSDPYVKVATTTTTFLAEKLAAHGKKVFLVPNKLSKKDLEIAEGIMEHKTWNKEHEMQNKEHKMQNIENETCNTEHETDHVENKTVKMKQDCSMLHAPCSTIRIGYFSGNLSHNQDFSSITEALVAIMEKHSEVELILAGPLSIKSTLNKFADRIKQLPYVDRKKHFANLASVDINLAPLEIDNPFCIAKSELKFFEAGIVQVPTVATANQTFCQAIEDGVDGFVAKDTQEWLEKLERLIADENLRKAMGAKAREKALANYTTSNAKNEEYYDYLKTKLKK